MAFLDDWKEKYKELLSNKQVQGLSRAAQSAGREFSSGAKQLGSAVGTAAVSPWENKRLQQEQRTADLIANTGRLRQARGADGSKYFNSAQRLTQNVANQQMGLGNRQVQAERDAKAGAFRTGLTVLGAGAGGRAIAGSALLGGGMGGLLSAATGQDVYEGVGSGVGSSMRYAGLNKLTAPLIDPFVQASGRFGANALGTIGKYGARAVAHGGANVLEDQYYTRLAESRAPSAMENLFSFGVGAAVSPMVNFDPKNSFIEIVDDKLTINPERYRDVLGRYAKEENIDLKQAKKVVDKWIGQQNEPTTIRIMKGDELVEEIVPKWRATMMDQPVGMSIKNVREGIVQPTKGDIKPQSTVGGVTKATDTLQLDKQLEIKQPSSTLERLTDEVPTKLKSGLQTNQITRKLTKQSQQTFDDIIAKGRKSIGKPSDPLNKNIKQVLDDTYTKWVDRYNPLSKAVKRVKTGLQKQGAELRPEYNPDYLVRRLTGAGGIADYKFKTELNPILKELETSNIPKVDMDTYLAHNRMLGFDQAGREVYGVNPQESKAVIEAMEQKYPGIKDIAGKFYDYQDRNLKELVEAGFFTAEDAASMRGQNPNYAPLYRVMDDIDEYLGLPTRKTMQGSSPVKKIKGSKRQILSPVESIIGDTFGHRAAIEKNRVAKSLVQMNQMVDLGFERVAKSGNDTITVWDNGQKQYWRVGQDIADVAKGVNEESMNLVLKIAQAPAQLLRQAATGRNPEFMFPNIIRDQLDAGITSKYGYLPFIDYVSGLKSMLANDDVYQSWQKSGAKIDLGELSGRKSVSKLFDEKTEKKGLFDWLSKGLDVAGVISEQPTRVGLYKKALKKTGNPLIAMMESRDATVDFARMGSKMKVANSIIPFLNVGVQGFDKLVRAGKDRPGKLLMNMGIYAAAPAATVTMYNLLNHPEEYAEIPQYEKDSNFIYDISRNENGTVDYKTIPKGNVVPFIANPIQSFLEYAAGSNPVSFKRMAMQTLSEGLPVLSGGGSLKEIATKTIGSNLPQAVKPITENLINKSFYKYDEKDEQAKEIVPYYLKDKPAYQQDYEFTPVMYKKIGAAFNVSPLQVKNLMEGYLAGYSKIPAQMVEMMTKYSRGEEISPNDKTLMRRFVKQTYPTSGSKAKEKEQPEVPGFMDRMTGKVSAAEETGMELPESTKDLGVLYDDVTRVVDSYQENKIKAQYGLVDKTLEEYQTEVDQALSLKKRIEQERPEQILTLEVDQHVSGGGKTTEERAEWAYKKIYDIPQAKRADFVKRLLEEKVLTKSVVEAIKDQYGLLIPLYNEGGKVKRFSTGGGSKPKKLPDSVFKTVKLVRPRSSGSTPRVRVNRKRIPNRVTLKAKQVVKI